jgi:hypothetical protein
MQKLLSPLEGIFNAGGNYAGLIIEILKTPHNQTFHFL